MGQKKSSLREEGYTIERETESGVIATKDGVRFFIKKIEISTNAASISNMETLKTTSHPHVMSTKDSFEHQNTCYVVMDYCEGGTLAEKIRRRTDSPQEFEVLSWIVEICMALKSIHEKGLLHKNLTPQNIYLTEFGTLCLGGLWKIDRNSNLNTETHGVINYLAPEVFTQSRYDSKSEMWSVGCILYELCTQKLAFSAGTTVDLISKIRSGANPHLQDKWSSEFRELFSDMLNRDPNSRPTAWEILARPNTLRFLFRKSKTTTDHLQTQLYKLKAVADNLESVHQGATIGSLTGGVIGAVGGITSIVGIALAPFTLGTSLVVTAIGAGVGVAGGVTAGVSNITNIVNQSSDRKAVQSIIKEFNEKINAVALWLQEISNSLQIISRCCSSDMPNDEDSSLNARFGTKVGKSISELLQLLRVVSIGRIAAQASRAVRVAAAATSVLSALFVAADIFFIAMDAKEIRNMRQTEARSEIMKFVQSVRDASKELQQVLDEFKNIISIIPSLEDERELQWQDME
ncbi:serine/threonine-protein kinase Nek8-like [Chelmon rostratus]|uniref:serine/threonine-protein kinase Nek8-like n=1 Tax=Chelmon rostratus TaxID=109905 RepID=UPI001BE92276|nr:serine/threonine-protein kinase Nek8-like [Chelmon rostratus]